MSFQERVHHLLDLLSSDASIEWEKEWPYLVVLGLVTLITGPAYLLAIWSQQWNNTTNPWDSRDHWAGTRLFAITFAVFALFFIAALIRFFPYFVTTWLQSAFSRFLFPFMVSWLLCLFFVPALTLALERVHPGVRGMHRVRLPSERPPPPPAPPPARKKNPVTTAKKNSPLLNTVFFVPGNAEQKPPKARVDSTLPPIQRNVKEGPVAAPLPSIPEGEVDEEEGWPPPAATERVATDREAEQPSEKRKPEPLDNLF